MSLRPGKLPPAALAALLEGIAPGDPRLLAGPGIGRDAAVIDLGGDRLLVATADPITFATEDIGWYAVHVNANDIACMGARPVWFMATVLLPPGADDGLPATIFHQITSACDALGITLIGGHTEVTIGIDRPIIAGTMLGEASRDEIVLGENVAAGDIVLLWGGIAIEGTALLARDAATTLLERGVSAPVLARARRMLVDPGISIVAAARELCAVVRPRMMHDATEGGVATALYEMAAAAGATIRIEPDAVQVYDETREICAALGLDPWGLLASGALLAIVAPAEYVRLTLARDIDIMSWRAIGRIEQGGPGVILGTGAIAASLPVFERDELARFFEREERGTDESHGTKQDRKGS